MIISKIKNLSIATKLFWSESRVIQDSSILYISNLITAGAGFLASLVIARVLGPSSFAIVAAYNAIVLTLIGFTDFGLGTGLIKHATPLLKHHKARAAAYLKSVFYIEVLIGLLLLVVGMILAPLLPKFLGQSEISINVVRVAVVSASITSTAAFVGAALATYKKFKLNAIISIIFGFLKLLTIVVLWKANLLSISSVVGLYFFLTVINALIGFLVIPRDYLMPVDRPVLKSAAKSILHFSIWLTISFFMTSIMGKLDFFYLLKIKGATEAGSYAAAQQLSQALTLLIGAIATVLTSHVSEKNDYESMVNFLRKSFRYTIVIAILFLLCIFIAPVMINILFGTKYLLAIQPLQLLIVHISINVLLLPVSLLFIPLGKVRIGTFITLLQLITSLLLYPLLISRFGINGAPMTVIICTLIGAIIYPLFLLKYLIKRRKDEYAEIS